MAYRTLAEAITRGRGRERAFICPVHGDSTASASVNVVKGVWVCYACHAHGSVGEAIENDDAEFIRDIEELLGATGCPTYPEAWLDQFHLPGYPASYWVSRFTQPAIDHFRLGYNHTRTVPAPCYPMRDPSGTVLGVVYRQLHTEPKYVYPRGVTKSGLLFNYSVDHSPCIVLVEGALDAVAVWEAGHRAFALYGSMLHRDQLALLHKVAPRRIVLALDNDLAGRQAIYGWTTDEGRYVPGLERRLSAAGFEVVVPDWDARPEKDIAEVDIATRRTLLDPFAL